jgi:hypothetical protein
MIDRTVAFVGDDEIEGFNWDSGVVDDFLRPGIGWRSLKLRLLFQRGVEFLLALEH